jgi:hypothetical protein
MIDRQMKHEKTAEDVSLTFPTTSEWCYNLVEEINKDHPNAAYVKPVGNKFEVWITWDYLKYVKWYTVKKCNIKS